MMSASNGMGFGTGLMLTGAAWQKQDIRPHTPDLLGHFHICTHRHTYASLNNK